ncbi:hypothetical protein CBM2609_B30245 [Cupriavidus taiwanensis]|nr:hypothetical protein CBM2604_B40243 [Cupriavidus taiwanensis]SOZ32564.1 hypothetical protein CBM2609_B30245 [Cupriavidus taiwanensis]SOZ48160.1 hypothetical protein CBM2610_B30243 [Cupriavidus taiwanensis]
MEPNRTIETTPTDSLPYAYRPMI